MVVNYDKTNIGKGIKGTGFTGILSIFKSTPEITDEVGKALEALSKINVKNINSVEQLKAKVGFANDDFLEFAKTADTSRDLFTQYKTHLEQTAQSTSKLGSAMSKVGSIGKTALAFAGNVAIMWTLSKGIELAAKAWDNYSHSQEKAKERGDTALSKSNQKSTVQNTLYGCTLQSALTLERM